MKRSALKRRTPLKWGKPLQSGKPLNRRAKLKARKIPKAFRARRDYAFQEYVRQQYCLLWNRVLEHPQTGRCYHVCIGAIQACHVKSRGSGGDDRGNLWPGCAGAHDEQHRIGIRSFQARWGIDLPAEAARLWARYLRETGCE